MNILLRIRPAIYASLVHLIGSGVVALICAVLVFGVWYPHPFNTLVGGTTLFFLIVVVDVVSGPLLTLIVFNPAKLKQELFRDIGLIVVFQLLVLIYGVYTLCQARPVFVAFEGSVFRVVSLPDIDIDRIQLARPELQKFSLTGPQLIGVRLSSNTDKDFPNSIQLAMEGLHPAFRPERWLDFESQSKDVIEQAEPLSKLREMHPDRVGHINEVVERLDEGEQVVGYIPLIAKSHTDWVVIITQRDGKVIIKDYLNLDPW